MADEKPAEVKPAQEEPVEAKPAEAVPTEAKPTEVTEVTKAVASLKLSPPDVQKSIIASLEPKEAEAFIAFSEKAKNSGLISAPTVPGDSRAGIDDEVTLQYVESLQFEEG